MNIKVSNLDKTRLILFKYINIILLALKLEEILKTFNFKSRIFFFKYVFLNK